MTAITIPRRLCLAVGLLALAPASFAGLGVDRAQAGSWKSGTYVGKLDAKDRPKTKIKLKITQKKIKLISAEFVLECDGERGRVKTKVRGGKDRLTEGPTGAGFAIYETERRRRPGYQQVYDLVGGVKGDVVRGQASMSRTYNRPYEGCNDKLTLEFKAKRR